MSLKGSEPAPNSPKVVGLGGSISVMTLPDTALIKNLVYLNFTRQCLSLLRNTAQHWGEWLAKERKNSQG